MRGSTRKSIRKKFFSENVTIPCAHCSVLLVEKSATLDHIIPGSCGGKNRIDNMAIVCASCNVLRDIYDFWLFRAWRRSYREPLDSWDRVVTLYLTVPRAA